MENKFSLRALFDNLRAVISNKYENTLNRIAKHSRAYNQLLFEHNCLLTINKNLPLIKNTIEFSNTKWLFEKLLSLGSLGNVTAFDTSIIRNSEPNDILVVREEFEKYRVQEEMRHFSGTGQVFTLKELKDPYTKIKVPINRVYVFSSIWLEDMANYNNLLFYIEEDKKKQLQEAVK